MFSRKYTRKITIAEYQSILDEFPGERESEKEKAAKAKMAAALAAEEGQTHAILHFWEDGTTTCEFA